MQYYKHPVLLYSFLLNLIFHIRRRQVNPVYHPDLGVVYNWALWIF